MIVYGCEMENLEEVNICFFIIIDLDVVLNDVVMFYQCFGDVGCWMFCDGYMQFNFFDYIKIVFDLIGMWCYFWYLLQDVVKRLYEMGFLVELVLDDWLVLLYFVQIFLNFLMVFKQLVLRVGIRSISSLLRRWLEISLEMQGILVVNMFRQKIEFIRDIVWEWSGNGGIGNSDMMWERRLRWMGMREMKNVQILVKYVWVSIGVRWGD